MLEEERIANVVPRDVEHKLAPAENPAKGLGYNVPSELLNGKASKIKDNAIGINSPIVATETDI
jgi:hypothetical protein